MVFSVVSAPINEDKLIIQHIDAAHATPLSLDAHAGSAKYQEKLGVAAAAVRGHLDRDNGGAAVGIPLSIHVLTVDADDAGNSTDQGGLQITFDQGAELAQGMGAGLALHWRVCG